MPAVAKKAFIDFDLEVQKKGLSDYDSEKFVVIKGMASTGDIDRQSDRILPEAWNSKTINQFKKNAILLFNHNSDNPIGKVFDLESTPKGLKIIAGVYRTWEKSDMVEDATLKAFSVGFKIEKKGIEYIESKDIFEISKVDLLEISVVSVPANKNALFSLAKSIDGGESSLEEFKEQLKEKEFSHANHTNMFEHIKSLFEIVNKKLGLEIDLPTDETADPQELIKSLADSIGESTSTTDQIATAVNNLTEEKTALEAKVTELEAAKEKGADTEDVDERIKALKATAVLKDQKIEELKDANSTYAKTINDLTSNDDTPPGQATPTPGAIPAAKASHDSVAGTSQY